MLIRRKTDTERIVEVAAQDFTRLVEQIMALRTEVRDALSKVEVGVRAQERAAQDARASAQRARRHKTEAQAALAGAMAAEQGAPVVGASLSPDAGEGS